MRHHLCTGMIAITIIFMSASISAAEQSESKDEWATKIIAEQRISQTICAEQSYLLSCTTEYLDDETGGKVRISQDECIQAVDHFTKAFLHDGKTDNKPAMFYLKLPQNIGSGYQMNYFAEELSKQIFAQIVQVLQQKGGSIVRNETCDQKLMTAFKANGN